MPNTYFYKMIPSKEDIIRSAVFKTSRSGGKGGQNVNKVSSKVELILSISDAPFFTEEERNLLLDRLAPRLDTELNLHITSQEDRSQLMNKERTIIKLLALLKASLTVQKKRRATKTPKSVIKKRRNDKQSLSLKKQSRRPPQVD